MTRNLDHHLQQHGNKWRVRLEIPAELRPQFGGQRHLMKAFEATTVREARLLRDRILSGFQLRITQARNPDDPVLQRARSIRDAFEQASLDDGDELFIDAVQLADEVEAREGQEAGDHVFHVALGTVIPLMDAFDEWVISKRYPAKTVELYRKPLVVLQDWCKAKSINTTVQAISKRVAWQFIDTHLIPQGLAPKTINRYLTAYRSYWRYLSRKSRVESNPWLDTHQDEGPRDDEEAKKPFTDKQIATLLKGEPPEPLYDLMMVAALTGARITAICELRVRDCNDGALFIKKAKKEPRDRTIPVHSKLRGIIARRVKGKKLEDFLFHDLPAASPTRPRSAAASQAFTRYRRSVGVGAGQGERSEYDFHSFRRWFISKADAASIDGTIISAVVGHLRGSITLDLYAKGDLMRRFKECVEAVKLPR